MQLDALAQNGVRDAPCRVQTLHLAHGHRFAAEIHDQTLARPPVVPGQRHQILHRGRRRKMPLAHGNLRGVRQSGDQREATTDPAARPIQALGQDILLEAVVLRELLEQPAVFEHAAPPRLVEAVGHDQRIGVAQLYANGQRYIAPQRAKSGNTQVAVDQHVAARAGRRGGDHRDDALLAIGCEAGAHACSARCIASAQSCVSKLEFAQLHLHPGAEVTEGQPRPLSRLAQLGAGLWRVCA